MSFDPSDYGFDPALYDYQYDSENDEYREFALVNSDGDFHDYLTCFSTFVFDRPDVDQGDKVILPNSALARLSALEIEYPMLFELCNEAADRKTHCGVLEFDADEGVIILPTWMMENLSLNDGDQVRVTNVKLPKATYLRLQPHTQEFLDLTNSKAVLERSLRSYTCLTVGETIIVPYVGKNYKINILEAKPEDSVSIVETDCEVGFALPLDYKEPTPKPVPIIKKPPIAAEPVVEEPKFKAFPGVARKLADTEAQQSYPRVAETQLEAAAPPQAKQRPPPAEKPKFKAFTGFGRRPLDTTAATAAQSDTKAEPPEPAQQPAQAPHSRLVFRASGSRIRSDGPPSEAPQPPVKRERTDTSEEEPVQFKAFIGKSYSLKD